MNWLQQTPQQIDHHGAACRFKANGTIALGWVMPDGVGVYLASGALFQCEPSAIVTADPSGLRLARQGAANAHLQSHDFGYTLVGMGNWEPDGDIWIQHNRAKLDGKPGTLTVRAQFKPFCAHLDRFHVEFMSDNLMSKQGSTPIRQGHVGILIATGEIVRTTSGRLTTPFPKLDFESERRASNTLTRVTGWLMVNALAEATARGDEYNSLMFEADLVKPTDASKSCAEEYLFGQQPAVPAPTLKYLSAPAIF